MQGRQALKIIGKRVRDGHPKKEIFEELIGKVKFRTDLLQMLAMVPDRELRAKYQNLNKVLFILLILVTVVKGIYASYLTLNSSIFMTPFILFATFVAGFFAFMVWNFRGFIYRILGLFGIVGILERIANFEEWTSYSSIEWVLDLALNLIPVSLIVILSFYIGFKVFPYYGFWGMLQEKKLDI